MNKPEQLTFRVQGLTCSDCAARFEQQVRQLPHVQDAQVHFATGKLTVVGTPAMADLERAGAFEQLRITPESQPNTRRPLWQNFAALRTSVAALLLLAGLVLLPHSSPWMFAAAILIGGYPIFMRGLPNLVRLRFDMMTLMTVAIIGAAAIGEWIEGAALVVLFAISEWLEEASIERARRSLETLVELAPTHVTVLRGGREVSVPVEEAAVGERMIIRPGDKISLDGLVVRGTSLVNQAAITGESIPVAKQVGDPLYAGTLNEEGVLEAEIRTTSEDTTLAKVIHLVEEAQNKKAPTQAFIDRFAKIYTPIVMLIAIIITVTPPLLALGTWSDWIYRGLALLVVACPCALIISTPVAIVTAIGRAAKLGVLIKGGIHLENASTASAVALDKTGTLTVGQPVVTDLIDVRDGEARDVDLDREQVAVPSWLVIAAKLEQVSRHPLAAAIVKRYQELATHLDPTRYDSTPHDASPADLSPTDLLEVTSFHSWTGKGIQGTIEAQRYYIGSPTWVQSVVREPWPDSVAHTIANLQQAGKTVVVVADEDAPLGLIALRDELRPSSHHLLQNLRKLGIQRTIMLTGDHQATATAIGQQLGISELHAELLPGDKWNIIEKMQYEGERVVMVGDGVNDAPALAAAALGIAMGGAASDTALETADIVLMGDDIQKLPWVIRLSRKTMQVIRQNVTLAIGLKVLAMLLIIAGWLPLWLAIAADVGATLVVTLNSIRLQRVREA